MPTTPASRAETKKRRRAALVARVLRRPTAMDTWKMKNRAMRIQKKVVRSTKPPKTLPAKKTR